jgi:hypothetical protein
LLLLLLLLLDAVAVTRVGVVVLGDNIIVRYFICWLYVAIHENSEQEENEEKGLSFWPFWCVSLSAHSQLVLLR